MPVCSYGGAACCAGDSKTVDDHEKAVHGKRSGPKNRGVHPIGGHKVHYVEQAKRLADNLQVSGGSFSTSEKDLFEALCYELFRRGANFSRTEGTMRNRRKNVVRMKGASEYESGKGQRLRA